MMKIRFIAAPLAAIAATVAAHADSALVTAATTELASSKSDAMAIGALVIGIAAAIAVVGIVISLVKKA